MTWKKGDVYLSFGNPQVTPFSFTGKMKDMSNMLYFYYDVTVLRGTKTLFSHSVHDFPKVQDLPFAIEQLLALDPKSGLCVDDYQEGGYIRKIFHNRVLLDDHFEREYYYLLERQDIFHRQDEKMDIEHTTNYSLTIGLRKYLDRKDSTLDLVIDQPVGLHYLNEEDLLRLSRIASSFCEKAIYLHNTTIAKEDSVGCE